jgi:hypothetical protein
MERTEEVLEIEKPLRLGSETLAPFRYRLLPPMKGSLDELPKCKSASFK